MSVAVDAGRTKCRARRVAAEGRGPRDASVPSRVTLADVDGPRQVAAAVAEALRALEAPATGQLCVAAAGAVTAPDAAGRLAGQLAETWPGPVAVTGDVIAAHAGAFHGRAGVVLAAGTGATALSVGAGGEPALVDGGGYLTGDCGSGFAIGRAGLAAALRHADGRPGGSVALAEAALARFVPPGPEHAPAVGVSRTLVAVAGLHRGAHPVREVAAFATDVAAAARGGDPVANAIWREAAADLADTVTTALRRQPAPEVALVGALFAAEDLLTTPLREEIANSYSDITVRVAGADALGGASWLASRATGAYEPLLVRAGATRPADGKNANLEEG